MYYFVQIDDKDYIIGIKKRIDESRKSVADEPVLSASDQSILEKINHLFDDKNSYVIRDYFLKNPSILFGMISIIAAGFVFLSGTIEYIVQYQFCHYWNINTDYIHISGMAPYLMALAIFSAIIILFVPTFFLKHLEILATLFEILKLDRKKFTDLKKLYRKNKKEQLYGQNILEKLIDHGHYPDKGELKEILLAYEQFGYEIKNNVSKTRKAILQFCFLIARKCIFLLLFIYFLTFIGYLGLTLPSEIHLQDLVMVLFYSITGFLSALLLSLAKYKFQIQEITEALADSKNFEAISEKLMEELIKHIGIVNARKKSIFGYLSDNICKKMISIALIMTLLLLASISFLNFYSISTQKEFEITSIEEKMYVVLFTHENYFLLKPVTISQDHETVIIDNEKLYYQEVPLSTTKKVFKEVVFE